MYETNEKPSRVKQRAWRTVGKIFIWSIPVAVVLTIIKEVFGIGF